MFQKELVNKQMDKENNNHGAHGLYKQVLRVKPTDSTTEYNIILTREVVNPDKYTLETGFTPKTNQTHNPNII